MASLYRVAQVVPRAEDLVSDHVKTLGFDVFNPCRVESRRVRHLGWVQMNVPVVPGYVFIRFDPAKDPWRPICTARGVQCLLGESPEDPFGVPNYIMDDFIARHAAGEFQDKPVVCCGLPLGAMGRVLTGLFEGRIGECVVSGTKRLELQIGKMRASFRVADVTAA